MSIPQSQTTLRPPIPSDGAHVFSLIKRCPPLDVNSMYCNLLQCTHFANTSVAAVQGINVDQDLADLELSDDKSGSERPADEKLVGFISGYLIPGRENTLFIWQVAVDECARGTGLAGKMLQHILGRSECSHVTYLETTITESNKASWGLFKSLANKLETGLEKSVMFDRDVHLAGSHDTELLARIGPFRLSNQT